MNSRFDFMKTSAIAKDELNFFRRLASPRAIVSLAFVVRDDIDIDKTHPR
jgi:hypothetical protein